MNLNIRLRESKPQRCRRPVGGWIKDELPNLIRPCWESRTPTGLVLILKVQLDSQNIRLCESKPQRCRRPVGGWMKEELPNFKRPCQELRTLTGLVLILKV